MFFSIFFSHRQKASKPLSMNKTFRSLKHKPDPWRGGKIVTEAIEKAWRWVLQINSFKLSIQSLTLLREELRFKSCQQQLNSKTQRCKRYGMHMNPVKGFVWRTRNMVTARRTRNMVEQQELESEKSFYHFLSPSVKDAHLCQHPVMLCTVFAPLCRWLCVHVLDSFLFYMHL